MWHKSIAGTSIPEIISDRICGELSGSEWMIKTNLSCQSLLCIFPVYIYRDATEMVQSELMDLELIASESKLAGPLIVLGDFNAHLGEEDNTSNR